MKAGLPAELPHDRRCKMVFLGQRAQRVISQINAAAEKLRDELLENVSAADLWYLRARAHADLRKGRRKKRKRWTGEIPVHGKKMNIVEEQERRVAGKAPKPAKLRRTRVHSIPRWAYVLFAVLAVLVLLRTFQRGVGHVETGPGRQCVL